MNMWMAEAGDEQGVIRLPPYAQGPTTDALAPHCTAQTVGHIKRWERVDPASGLRRLSPQDKRAKSRETHVKRSVLLAPMMRYPADCCEPMRCALSMPDHHDLLALLHGRFVVIPSLRGMSAVLLCNMLNEQEGVRQHGDSFDLVRHTEVQMGINALCVSPLTLIV
jgi:hypothetical protein